jgi:hypothetical protein
MIFNDEKYSLQYEFLKVMACCAKRYIVAYIRILISYFYIIWKALFIIATRIHALWARKLSQSGLLANSFKQSSNRARPAASTAQIVAAQ